MHISHSPLSLTTVHVFHSLFCLSPCVSFYISFFLSLCTCVDSFSFCICISHIPGNKHKILTCCSLELYCKYNWILYPWCFKAQCIVIQIFKIQNLNCIALKNKTVFTTDRIHNTSFSSNPMKGPNKVKCFVPGKPFQKSVTQHSSLLGLFVSYEENKLLQIRSQSNNCTNVYA